MGSGAVKKSARQACIAAIVLAILPEKQNVMYCERCDHSSVY